MTAEDLRAEIAAHPEPLRPVWIGRLVPGGELRAIVEETELRRLYLWPELTAWRKPLPPETEAAPRETLPAIRETQGPVRETKPQQMSLF